MNESSPNSITCETAVSHLMAYVKGDLSPEWQRAIQQHIVGCDACAQAVQEARLLDTELSAVGRRQRPILSPEASQRIQEQVYRRMRRALFLHRTRDAVQMAGAFAVTAVSLVILALFGGQWLQFIASPNPTPPVTAVTIETLAATEAVSAETAVDSDPTSLPPLDIPIEADNSLTASQQLVPQPAPAPTVPIYWANLQTLTPGSDPAEIAGELFTAALAGDRETLGQLFVAMRAPRQPTLRMWLMFYRRCLSSSVVPNLQYHVVPADPKLIARVDVYNGDQFVGEVKMRRINNEWFTVFTSYPTVKGCYINP
ncbi:MAG: zf-HC2 domain-containing protein [Ardenticatenaceae bacterium]|nr:zf-HC2 domain-containing protein [Anaerolineales bacterium]MCB8923934.1 zf-HC2 domain-containing protein [Ardenticatenaceae bacterium]MCB8990952.1 zf-HC2 domain-containing protein [Ardenticatenaceae bacterium]MCB9004397.1 zf-HC2 domain-containing protein [Ardenticatenaceae bacterium]